MSGDNLKSIVDFHIDVLSGIDVSALSTFISSEDSADTTIAIATIQENLASLNSTITTDYLTQQNVILSQQQEVLDILEREQNRLYTKKDHVDNVLGTQLRINKFNDSYSSRNSGYLSLFLKICIALILILVFTLLEKYTPMPSIISTVAYIIIGAYLVIMVPYDAYYIYIRDRMNFDKISQKLLMSPEATDADTFVNKGGGDTVSFEETVKPSQPSQPTQSDCIPAFDNSGLQGATYV